MKKLLFLFFIAQVFSAERGLSSSAQDSDDKVLGSISGSFENECSDIACQTEDIYSIGERLARIEAFTRDLVVKFNCLLPYFKSIESFHLRIVELEKCIKGLRSLDFNANSFNASPMASSGLSSPRGKMNTSCDSINFDSSMDKN